MYSSDGEGLATCVYKLCENTEGFLDSIVLLLCIWLLFCLSLQDAGDFASVAFFVLKNRCPEKGR